MCQTPKRYFIFDIVDDKVASLLGTTSVTIKETVDEVVDLPPQFMLGGKWNAKVYYQNGKRLFAMIDLDARPLAL